MSSKKLSLLSLGPMATFGLSSIIMPLELAALAASFLGGLTLIFCLGRGLNLASLGLLFGQSLALFALSLIAGLHKAQETIPFTGLFIALGFLLGLWISNSFKVWLKLLASGFLVASIIVQSVLFPSPQYLSLGIPLLVVGSLGLNLSRVLKW